MDRSHSVKSSDAADEEDEEEDAGWSSLPPPPWRFLRLFDFAAVAVAVVDGCCRRGRSVRSIVAVRLRFISIYVLNFPLRKSSVCYCVIAIAEQRAEISARHHFPKFQ